MARNPGAEAPFAAFGALLDRHLREGTRPGGGDREPWTNTAFAKTQPGRGDAAGVAPNTVANWRKGKSAPSQVEPILRALFGPLRSDGGAEREALRAAYLAAKEPEDRKVVASVRPDPAGETFIPQGDGLAINRAPAAADIEVAAEPAVQEEHEEALRNARRLSALIARRHNTLTDYWSDLLPTAERFLRAIDRPSPDLPACLAAMYQSSVGLGSLLEQDAQLRARPEEGEQPLPVDLRRVLSETVTSAVLLTRAFPANRDRDTRVQDFWRVEALPQARQMIAATKVEGDEILPAADIALLEEIDRDAARAGVQGDKSKGRLFATLRNMVLAGATAVFLSGYANESVLVKRLSRFVARAEAPIIAVLDGMPADVLAAMRNVMERAKDAPGGTGTALVPPVVVPDAPRRERGKPPPDFDLDEVKRMILAGEAPPAAWVPFIDELDFAGGPLRNLDPLRGLTSLQTLLLDSTPVSDLDALRGLTSLQTLSLDSTPVSDLDALRGLTSLQTLLLDSTPVSDLDALRGLTSLQRLWLNSTPVSDLDALRGLTSLQTLRLNGTPVSDLDALRGLTSLQTLWLNSTPVSDLDALRGLTSLQTLWLNGTQVSDLDALRGLTSLQTLWLNSTPVSDLDALRGLTSLQELWLDGTQVSDLDSLRGLAELMVVDCGTAPVRDIAPLTVLPKLLALHVRVEAIRDWRIVDRFGALERLYVDGEVPRPRPPVKRRGLKLVFNGDDFTEVANDLVYRESVRRRHASKRPPRRARQPNR
jgi:hypothetical protein